jgi:hypothetical protein
LELQVDLTEGEEAKQPSERPKEVRESKDMEMSNLQRFLQDLVLTAEFRRPNWYPQAVPVDREFGKAS